MVLSCYEMAKYYQVDPRIFLRQTISELARHRYWTGKLIERVREAQEAAEAEAQRR